MKMYHKDVYMTAPVFDVPRCVFPEAAWGMHTRTKISVENRMHNLPCQFVETYYYYFPCMYHYEYPCSGLTDDKVFIYRRVRR